MLQKIKELYLKVIQHIKYWKSLKECNSNSVKIDKKIVVFESDDWGSIRVPSKETFKKLLLNGEKMKKDVFLHYDSVENVQDLCALSNTLSLFKDSSGRHPCFTLNFAVANPNFEKIRENNNKVFFREWIDVTYSHSNAGDVIGYVNKQIKTGVFFPQLHCLEHMRSYDWLDSLKQNDTATLKAFENNMIGIYSSFSGQRFGYMDSLNYSNMYEDLVKEDLRIAILKFESMFGFKSKSFVPPCHVWNNKVMDYLFQFGIDYIQTGFYQYLPCGSNKYKPIYHFTGEKNDNGQIFFVRNCSLEPVYFSSPKKAASFCLKQIKIAFEIGVPAIIDTHRVNYVGSIFQSNRENGNRALLILLKRLLQKYPDVLFMSSDELHSLIKDRI